MRTRRDFLKITLIGAPVLALAFRAEELGAADSFAPNGWVRIDADGTVTLTVGKSEMGQGVRTSLPMILADELEADWRSVRIVQAEPSAAFPNLGTGGSFSVQGSFRSLRRAGAAAREMLVTAAAAKWSVAGAACRAEGGAVIHDATRRRLTYGELTGDAAKLAVPAEVALKPVRDFRIVGRP